MNTEDSRDANECRVCGETMALIDGCDWPDGGAICYTCLDNEKQKLAVDLTASVKLIRDAIAVCVRLKNDMRTGGWASTEGLYDLHEFLHAANESGYRVFTGEEEDHGA